jgi:predicted CopG family antitoxin
MPDKDNKQRVNIMLREEQREYLAELAEQENKSLSEIIRQLVDEKRQANQSIRLQTAAEALADDYRSNEELTAFNALDGEDFA